MDCYLIEVMLKEVQKGRKVDYTFNNQAEIDMLILFKETIALQHDKIFLNRDSFHWKKSRQMVTAYGDVWVACGR